MVGTGTLTDVEPNREDRSVTRLGLWLTGPWPAPAGKGPAEDAESAGGTGRAGAACPSVLDGVAALAEMAEQSGFDSLWVTDEVASSDPDSSGNPAPEAYSLLGALAARTHSARLGALPIGVDRRHPSIVAKVITGIDVISHGRGVLTYGLGAADVGRGERLIEALRVGRALLKDEVPTVEGTFYSVVEAMNRPSPVQDGGIPIAVFVEHHADLATVAVTEFIGLADVVIVEGRTGDVGKVADSVHSVPWVQRLDDRRGAGPLQVIGIAPKVSMPPSGASADSDGGSLVARTVRAIRDLFGAGVDGCIVPVDLSTPPEVVAAIGTGLGDGLA